MREAVEKPAASPVRPEGASQRMATEGLMAAMGEAMLARTAGRDPQGAREARSAARSWRARAGSREKGGSAMREAVEKPAASPMGFKRASKRLATQDPIAAASAGTALGNPLERISGESARLATQPRPRRRESALRERANQL